MMMKSLFLALVAAIAVCSQQAQAAFTPLENSNGLVEGGGAKISWNKNGNTVAITLEADAQWVLYTFGPSYCPMQIVEDLSMPSQQALALMNEDCRKTPGHHGGSNALVCTETLCKSTNGGEMDGPDFPDGAAGWTCTHSKVGNTISGTCTRTITGNADAIFPVGETRGAVASGTYNCGQGHAKAKGLPSMITGTYVAPEDPNATEDEEIIYPLCSAWNVQEAKKGMVCENPAANAANPKACSSGTCGVYDCCLSGIQIQGDAVEEDDNGNDNTKVPVGGSTTTTPGCSMLMNSYLALGQKCPNNQYLPIANQCQLSSGDCRNWQECCQVQMVENAGSLASPALAVVLASALAMLALLF